MKSLVKFYLLSILSVCIIFTSCGDDDVPDPEPQTNTIVDIAVNDSRFTSLVAALQKANLVDALSADGSMTVFAPTNEAFNNLFGTLGVSGLDALSAEALTPILLYHVLGTEVLSSSLTAGYVTSLSTSGPGQSAVDMLIGLDNGVSINSTSNVTQADIDADNGVIHVIDEVLLPPNVVEAAIDNNIFASLVSAVVEADLVDALSADGPFTVFAPTNEAFQALLTALGVSSLSEIPMETLTEVLLYHVVSGNVKSTDLTAGAVPTLNDMATIAVTLDSGVQLNGSTNVIATDVQMTNGIIHVIDQVLLPPSASNSIVDIALSDSQFSILVDAVTRADLAGVLSGDGNFTVFAPTNDAFMSLLTELGLSSLDDLSNDAIKDIVLYHAIGSEVFSADLTTSYVSSLNTTGPNDEAVSIYVNTDNGVILNGSVNVTSADIDADNGVVHVIDKVLLPPNVVDAAIANNTFASLVSAVVEAGLVEALSAEGPFTIFAPTNDAFAALLTDLDVSAVSEIPTETLTAVLLYHVVSGNVKSSDLTTGMVPTLNTENMITVSIDNGVTLNDGVNVISTDVQTVNGIIHVIDKVLVPTL